MTPLGDYQSRLLKLNRHCLNNGFLCGFLFKKDGLPVQSFTQEN